jgi:hypothetical protein
MNKFQKSLDRIKKNVPLHEDSWTDEDKEHIITIMEALEKQIPKKPKNREGTTYFYCPHCDSNNINEYCGDCGQALDWSDTE